MEEIIRCDRCGKQIEEFKTLKYVTIESPTVMRFPNCETYELCSECTNKIIEWINAFHSKENEQELINWINHKEDFAAKLREIDENVAKMPRLEEVARSLFGALPEEDNEN